MSDTPRTDKREKVYWKIPTLQVSDVWKFARELERENAALREDKARLIKALVDVADRVHTRYSGLKHETITAIDAARKEAQP